MPAEMGRYGLSPGLPAFPADRGCDSNHNCQVPFETGIAPGIKRRGGAVSRGRPHRGRAAEIFGGEYRQRGMAGGVFGGGGSRRRQPHCRFILPDSRRRFGKIRTIAWNNKVPNRFRRARMRGMGMPSCGTASRV